MADRVGQQLGNYRLTQLLGKGGFAEVYVGEHIYLETQAAIKVLLTQLASEDMEPFRLEAKRVAYLEHPHIVRVLDFGVDGTTPYLVMSYAPNGTLRQRHPKGVVLPLPTILGYVKQAADALQYAHDEHFIHRDVKPENLLVGRRQEVLLSDFGIALLSQTSRSQSMQDVAGTASYMAPEQFQGKPRPASDQYSLGIIVYEWLSGDRPFHGSFTEIASQHLFVLPPPLHERMSDIPMAVEQVVMTALTKDPKERFSNVQAFATALEQAVQTDASHTLPASQPVAPIDVMPPTRPIYLPSELATFPDESITPTELITPPSQTTTPTVLSVPTSQTTVPKGLATPPDHTTPPPTKLAASASLTPFAAKPSVLFPERMIPQKPPKLKQGVARNRTIFLIGVALLVVIVGAGILYNTIANQGVNTVHSSARVNASTATAQIQSILTQSTSGIPSLDDPMHDNSQGYNWDQGKYCYFGPDRTYHVVTPYAQYATCLAERTDFSNFAFQVQLRFNNQGRGRILFRANSVHTTYYYLDVVGGSGECILQSTGNLNYGLGCSVPLQAAITFTIIAKSDKLYVFLNNRYLGMTADSSFSNGQIGVGSDGYGLDMAVSNVKVWKL